MVDPMGMGWELGTVVTRESGNGTIKVLSWESVGIGMGMTPCEWEQ